MSDQLPTVTLTIDGQTVTVPKGTTIWHAASGVGIDIPIFCYHDRMPPLGACRMCLVKVEKAPKLLTSCTQEAADGMVVSTTTPDVKAGQEAILEFLLINHPLDCPICDKGGECPLQDQTFRYGPGRSRYVEVKRDFAKPVSLGPALVLDRERCILCWRCVRFGEIIAGDDALKGFERGFTSEINTPFTLPADSKFIGNTIAICPVGALTSRTYRFVARPWDNQRVPSVCTLCGVGCAVFFDVRGNTIMRTQAREAPHLNDIWLCDLGFFGHGYVHHAERLQQPLIRRDSGLQPASWDEALDLVARKIRAAAPSRVALIAGARLTNEDAYVASRVFRTVVGTPHLDHRLDTRPDGPSLGVSWGMTSPIGEIPTRDVFVLVGCDLTEEYPVLWLRMKQAVDRGAAIIAITPKGLEINRFVAHHLVHRYPEGSAVLAALALAVAGKGRKTGEAGGVDHGRITSAGEALRGARQPMVMIGKTALEAADGEVMYAEVEDLCGKLGVRPSVMRGKGNAFGAALAGLLPNTAPGGRPLAQVRGDLQSVWGAPVAVEPGLSGPHIVEAGARGELDVLYVAGADPSTDVLDRSRWTTARSHVPFVVVADAFLTETAQAADVVLPALVIPEKDGTVSNIEGRVQRVHAAVIGPGEARGDWQILSGLAARLGTIIAYSRWEEIFDEMKTLIPGLEIDAIVPLATPAQAGSGPRALKSEGRPAAADGDYPLVLIVGEVLFDRGSMSGRSPAVADLAREPWAMLHPDDAAKVTVAEGDPIILTARRGSIAVTAKVSKAVMPGHVYIPRGYDAAPVNAIVDLSESVARVRVRPLAAAGAQGDV